MTNIQEPLHVPQGAGPKDVKGIKDKLLHGLAFSWGIGRLVRAVLPAGHKYSQTSVKVHQMFEESRKALNESKNESVKNMHDTLDKNMISLAKYSYSFPGNIFRKIYPSGFHHLILWQQEGKFLEASLDLKEALQNVKKEGATDAEELITGYKHAIFIYSGAHYVNQDDRDKLGELIKEAHQFILDKIDSNESKEEDQIKAEELINNLEAKGSDPETVRSDIKKASRLLSEGPENLSPDLTSQLLTNIDRASGEIVEEIDWEGIISQFDLTLNDLNSQLEKETVDDSFKETIENAKKFLDDNAEFLEDDEMNALIDLITEGVKRIEE